MTAGLEAVAVQAWIVTTLSEDPELAALAGGPSILMDRIWDGEYQGSEEECPWWISYTCQDSVDVKGVGAVQVMARVQFQVKVVARGKSYLPALPVYLQVHSLMEARLNQTSPYGDVFTTMRVSGFQYPERTDGLEYRHLGGTYETLAQ